MHYYIAFESCTELQNELDARKILNRGRQLYKILEKDHIVLLVKPYKSEGASGAGFCDKRPNCGFLKTIMECFTSC